MKKILFVLLASVVLSGSVSQSAFADDTSSGCGLGWQVSQKMSILSSAIRSTTDLFLPNTFSMTSGTSGCAKHDIVKNDEKAVQYAVNNYDSLIVEMAEGHGEFLTGFAESLGCAPSAVSNFESFTQSRYQKILDNSANDGIQFYRAVRTQLMTSPELENQCVPSV